MSATQIKLDIKHRNIFAGGFSFGSTGPYEQLQGIVHFSLDPDDINNRMVIDLDKAPRNGQGMVQYSTDFCILKPLELNLGNRRIIFEVCNRGNKRLLQYFNDAIQTNQPEDLSDAGNGFLMYRGYTIVWCGWQGDILAGDGRITMSVPIAHETSREISGPVRLEYVAGEESITCIPLSGNDYTESYESTSLDTSQSRFTYRHYPYDERIEIANESWQFANYDYAGNLEPSNKHCYFPSGFNPGWIYELIYPGQKPSVLGLGFLAVRDFLSFLRNGTSDENMQPNPLVEGETRTEKVYAWGISQSGRYLREFVYSGYNQGPNIQRVFDAIWPHVAGAGRIWLNGRFAQPGRYPCQQTDHTYPSDQFPFAYSTTTDHLTGIADGIMKRPESDPLLFHTQTSAEYWERRGSLAHTTTSGHDLAPPDNVRMYMYAGAQHSNQPHDPPELGPHRHLTNPHNITTIHRALLDALNSWATYDLEPPESRIPTRASHTLTSACEVADRFPKIPNAVCPKDASRLFVQNFGTSFKDGIVSLEPPEEDLSREYIILVPQIDEDGNEIPGIRTPDIAVPLATYTGWNFRPENWAAEAMDDLKGSFFPLDYSRTQGKLSKDPRTTWKERYISRARYVRMVVAAVEQLVEDRLLLDEDADRYVNEALIFDTIRGHDLNLEGFRRKHERWTHLGSPEAGFKPT